MDAVQIEKAVKALGEKPTLKNFVEQFGVFAQGPGGISKLREVILNLGVAGRLHEYKSSEKSINLLDSLRKQRAEKIKLKEIRKGKPFSVVDKKYFSTPEHWVWAMLGEWGDWGSGATPSRRQSAFYGGDIPWFKSGELTGGIITKSEETITQEAVDNSSVRSCKSGDVLVAMYGATIGKTAILGVAATTNQAVCACTCFVGIFNEFLHLLLKAYNSIFTGQGAGGAQPNISREKIINTPAPLPPLEEQKRIVAKVDELMVLCDQLEARQQQQANTLLKANSAAIHALLSAESSQSSKTKADRQNPQNRKQEDFTTASDSGSAENAGAIFSEAWERIANNFHALYGNTLPMPPGEGRQKKYFVGLKNVKELRKCIFKLAVSGNLTARGNGSAANDLNNILKTRKRLEDGKKIKKYNINNDEKELMIPETWELTRLGCITDVSSGSTPLKGKSQYYENGTIPWVTSSATSNEFIFSSDVLISKIAVKECNLTLYAPGTLLMAMYGQGKTRGQVAELKIAATTNQACSAISFFERHENIRPYIKIVLCKLYDEIRELADGGAQPNLNGIKVKATPIPFPPLEEQKRIVAKVDQLMKICDKLEQQLTTAYSDAEKLINATIKTLVA